MRQKKPLLSKKRVLPPGFFTTRDLAEFLQLHPVTVLKFAKSQGDGIPHIRVLGKYYFSEEEVIAWIDRHTQRTPSVQAASAPPA